MEWRSSAPNTAPVSSSPGRSIDGPPAAARLRVIGDPGGRCSSAVRHAVEQPATIEQCPAEGRIVGVGYLRAEITEHRTQDGISSSAASCSRRRYLSVAGVPWSGRRALSVRLGDRVRRRDPSP